MLRLFLDVLAFVCMECAIERTFQFSRHAFTAHRVRRAIARSRLTELQVARFGGCLF